MCITWPHICFTIHLLWCMTYIIIGSIQLVAGIFFLVWLPFLKLGSNVWVGAWNIFFGVGGAVIALIGKWTLQKQRTFLYLAISILIINIINLVILEIGEWHIMLPERAKKIIDQGNAKNLVMYARTITSLGTVVAAVIAFLDSQITFCSMQYHEKYYKKDLNEKQDVLSDTEYVLPRVKSDSDETENVSYCAKQYPQSWVYETQTADTSTTHSVPNRYSLMSDENALNDSKQTSTETEFKDISTQNLNVEQPVVVVENTSDYTDRQLHYMASFSRTPSPVAASDTSSEDSCSIRGPPIQESLEKLTESSVYRSRLNSALSANTPIAERPPSCISPRPPSISAAEQVQHDSLMVELQETISNKSNRSYRISADQYYIPLKDEPAPIELKLENERQKKLDVFVCNVIPKTEQSKSIECQTPTKPVQVSPRNERISFPDFVQTVMSSPVTEQNPLLTLDVSRINDISDVDPVSSSRTKTEQQLISSDAEQIPITPDTEQTSLKMDLSKKSITPDAERKSITSNTQKSLTPDTERSTALSPDMEEFQNEDIESNNSNNVSTDKETIIEFKGSSDDDIEMPCQEEPPPAFAADRDNHSEAFDLIEDIMGADMRLLATERSRTEIDDIFRIAENVASSSDQLNIVLPVVNSLHDDEKDDDSINDVLPPPQIDTSDCESQEACTTFVNIPPPDETEEMNGVDPEEWEESEEDSVDSGSCIRHIPPPSTPN